MAATFKIVHRWRIFEKAAFAVRGDAEDHASRLRKKSVSSMQVRTFPRTVRAGGAVVDVFVVVQRKRVAYEVFDLVKCGAGHSWEESGIPYTGNGRTCPACGPTNHWSCTREQREVPMT